MRIGIFTNTYKPDISGVIRSISTFRNELIRQGHTVYIFAPETADYEDEEYGVFRYPAIKVPAKVNFPLAIPVSPYIDWVVPRLKLNVLHSQHPILIGEEAITFAKNLNLPHIFTHHTQYEEYTHYIPFNQNIVKTLQREVVRAHLIRSVKIIAPTESIKALISEKYPEVKDRMRVLPTPINLERFQPQKLRPEPIRQKYQLGEKFTFVSVGRLTPEKNFGVLLKAFARATTDYPEARLLIVGDGPNKKELSELAGQLQIADRVIFVGAVGYNEVPHYLAVGNAFAFASTSETQGLVMAEGMAAGLPVVAVDAPGNRDVVQNDLNGLLVENTSFALAEGMRQFLNNPEKCPTLSKGALKTAENYSVSQITIQLVEIYQEAIDLYKKHPLEYKRFPRETDQLRQFPPKWLVEITGGTEWLDSLVSFWHKLGS
jgi:glycosyltransferase involved in cell wall biosynthesis